MNDPIKHTFNFSDGINHDATVNETSEVFTGCYNYVWNVTPTNITVTGVPTYTIEVSSDGVSWFEYDLLFTDVSTINAVEDTQLSFTMMRINHKSGTASAGTVSYLLTIKKRN